MEDHILIINIDASPSGWICPLIPPYYNVPQSLSAHVASPRQDCHYSRTKRRPSVSPHRKREEKKTGPWRCAFSLSHLISADMCAPGEGELSA